MAPPSIDILTARRLLIRAQGLDRSWALPPGKAGAAEAIQRLGYVQIDTIAVVERAHHHVIWCRCPDYAPAMLDDLLARDRRVFEYWTHAAAYVPMADYRFYLPRMRAYAARAKPFLAEHRKLVRHVLDRLKREGPLPAGAFAAPDVKRGPWWDWTPAKRVLETLLHCGKVMVANRRNFERQYDLTERVLPGWVDTTLPTDSESARFIVHQVLRTQAIATRADLKWGHGRTGTDPALRKMLKDGQAVEVRIAGIDEPHYALAETSLVDAPPVPADLVQILSPFDTFLRRDRIQRLFGYEYRIECYTPAPKRQFGYFCLPILHGDRLIGRMDAKAMRAERVLVVRHLAMEPRVCIDGALPDALSAELHRFAAFNGCDAVKVERTTPTAFQSVLSRMSAMRERTRRR